MIVGMRVLRSTLGRVVMLAVVFPVELLGVNVGADTKSFVGTVDEDCRQVANEMLEANCAAALVWKAG